MENDEQTKQLAVLEDAVDEAWEPREEAVIDLVNTKPTTLAGVVALCRYIEPSSVSVQRRHTAPRL